MTAILIKDLKEALTAPVYEQKTRLDAAKLAELRKSLTVVPYKPFDPILEFNRQADEIYFVLSGRVHNYEKMGDEQYFAFDIVRSGGFFGEVGTLYDGNRSASTVALEKTELLVLEMKHFPDFQARHPDVVRLLLKGMAERLSRSGKELRNARLRDPNAIGKENPTSWDRFIKWVAWFVGTGYFLALFVVAMIVWGVLYKWHGLDPNVVWIALALSITQIVIGNLVLNSQQRAAKLEEKIDQLVKESIIKADKTITTVREEQENLKTEIRNDLRQLLHDLGKQP